MSATAISAANLFRSFLGPEAVREATQGDAVPGVQPQLVLEPSNELQLASALRLANDAGLAVIPRGGGTKLGWGNPPSRADLVLSTKRLDRILEHVWADMTVSVEAGCTIGALQAALAKHGQRLAIDVLWPKSATIGGMLSANDSGALRLRFGSLRDLIIGVTIALPDGTLASSGGKVVKNVAGYDLPKLVTGAFGTLGVITRAVFRLHPLPKEASTISCLAHDPADAQRIVLAIQDSKLAHSALQVRFVEGAAPQVDVLFEATFEGIAAQTATLKSLVGVETTESDPPVWRARQELFVVAHDEAQASAIAKLSFLPAQLAGVADAITRIAAANHLRATFVSQAFGIATVLFLGQPPSLRYALDALRHEREAHSGSLVIQQRPDGMPPLDAWALPAIPWA